MVYYEGRGEGLEIAVYYAAVRAGEKRLAAGEEGPIAAAAGVADPTDLPVGFEEGPIAGSAEGEAGTAVVVGTVGMERPYTGEAVEAAD